MRYMCSKNSVRMAILVFLFFVSLSTILDHHFLSFMDTHICSDYSILVVINHLLWLFTHFSQSTTCMALTSLICEGLTCHIRGACPKKWNRILILLRSLPVVHDPIIRNEMELWLILLSNFRAKRQNTIEECLPRQVRSVV